MLEPTGAWLRTYEALHHFVIDSVELQIAYSIEIIIDTGRSDVLENVDISICNS